MNKIQILKQKYEESSAHKLYSSARVSPLLQGIRIWVDPLDAFYTRNKYTPITSVHVKVFFQCGECGITVHVTDTNFCTYKVYSRVANIESRITTQTNISKTISAVAKALRIEKRKYDIAKLKQSRKALVEEHINSQLNECNAKVINLSMITGNAHRYIMDIDTNKSTQSTSNLLTLIASKKLDSFKIYNMFKDLELTFDEIKDLLKVIIKARRRNKLIERLDAL